MKLNPDCVRDILLALEEHDSYQAFLELGAETVSSFSCLRDYPLEKILYHIKKCDEAGFLTVVNYYPDSVVIGGLHYRGHEFLNNIRENKVWSGVKSVAGKIGTNSLQGLTQIAAATITSLIKAQFGLP